MNLLKQINDPADMRKLPVTKLQPLADEIREYMIETLSKIGGHTGASLGPVELILALHYAFDTPRDRLVLTSATRRTRTRLSPGGATSSRPFASITASAASCAV